MRAALRASFLSAAATLAACGSASAGAEVPVVEAAPSSRARPNEVAPAQLQPLDVDAFSGCLIESSGPSEEEAVRRMLVTALQDDVAAAKDALATFSELLFKLSVDACGLNTVQLADPAYARAYEDASGRYGEVLGDKLMQDALAKMN